MADKIQMTEEQAREDFKRIIPFAFLTTTDEELFFETFITNMKNAGYIRKSLLQQKVEEAEKIWVNFCENDLQDDLHCIQHDIIQLFKEKHPEDFI